MKSRPLASKQFNPASAGFLFIFPLFGNMKRRLFYFFILLYSVRSQAQEVPSFIKDSLDTYIRSGMKDWQIPGLAVAIVKDGHVVFMKGYGVRNIQKTDPVDENTLFMIGSNTKAFTATALSMLAVEKKLSLDDKVTKWMPTFKLNDPLASENVTVRDLLCHRIGFGTFQGDFTYWTSSLTRKEVIEKMAHVHAQYGFRARWGYCNAAFTAAGELIPAIANQSWEAYLTEKIFKPLHMERTILSSGEMKKASNASSAHTVVHGKLTPLEIPDIDNLGPAGSISSSVSDMTHWVIAQLDMGKYENQQVIPAAAISATRSPQSILGLDQRDKTLSHFALYGLGFFVSDRAGKLVVAHTGGVDGFVTSLMLVPEEKLGIIVLTNTDQNNFFQNLTDEIRDSFLHLPYSGYKKQLERVMEYQHKEDGEIDSLRAVVAKNNKAALPLESYTGRYQDVFYGDATVALEHAKLAIHFSHHPKLIGQLELLADNSFLCTYSIPTFGIKVIPFHVEQGKVKSFTLRVADFVEYSAYEFAKQ
jgi:CubicO group peptidase (beta-lactamase class C family)